MDFIGGKTQIQKKRFNAPAHWQSDIYEFFMTLKLG